MKEYKIVGARQEGGELVAVDVEVPLSTGASHRFTFVMKQKDIGRKEGSWMTKTILKH